VHAGRHQPGAVDLEEVFAQVLRESFRHLAPAGITGTKEHHLQHGDTIIETWICNWKIITEMANSY
jgi:hypothetical protein